MNMYMYKLVIVFFTLIVFWAGTANQTTDGSVDDWFQEASGNWVRGQYAAQNGYATGTFLPPTPLILTHTQPCQTIMLQNKDAKWDMFATNHPWSA